MAAADEKRKLVIERFIDLDVVISLRCTVSIVTANQGDQRIEALRPTQTVDRPTSSGREQPGSWPVWHAVGGPAAAGFSESLLHRIFGSSEVAEVPDEDRDETRPFLAEDLGDSVRRQRQPSKSITGRTSTRPNVAFGILAAQLSASSRLATSIT